MSKKRIVMGIQEEILRLKNQGISKRKVSQLLKIDRGTIGRYWDQLEVVTDIPTDEPLWAKKIDWNYIESELGKVSKKILYEEQKESIKLPSYQAFCQYIRNNKSVKKTEVTIKIDRAPGASVEVDWSGDSMDILNPTDGELYSVELFVGSMSFSGEFYAEFTINQKLDSFIFAHNNMFKYFGGVASYIIPDNCKTAVIKADKYDPVINSTYHDMCKHYGIVVDPADSYSPRHKPNVENAVKYLQTDFMARIRNKTYTSLVELNRDLRDWLKIANQKEIQGRGNSRDYFFDKEKDFLKELPSESYELYFFKKAKVHPDCHFQHDKNYYSVPHQYVGKEIDIKFNNKMVHAYLNCNRIATHRAAKGSWHYNTNIEHYPEDKYVEVNYHLASAKKEAEQLGPYIAAVINKLLKQSKYPLKVLRKIQGILRLKSVFSVEELEHGCEMAIEFDKLNYNYIKKFSKNYKNMNKDNNQKAPVRQLEFICLQGGIRERN
jgi:transposase